MGIRIPRLQTSEGNRGAHSPESPENLEEGFAVAQADLGNNERPKDLGGEGVLDRDGVKRSSEATEPPVASTEDDVAEGTLKRAYEARANQARRYRQEQLIVSRLSREIARS